VGVSNPLVVAAIGVGTYLIRLSFIGILGTRRLPPVLERALEFIAPAVLAALVVPAVVRPEGTVDLSPDNLKLFAALAAAAVAWATRNVLATIATGLSMLWLLDWLV
jgi:branched-subunit amino acid transport protein